MKGNNYMKDIENDIRRNAMETERRYINALINFVSSEIFIKDIVDSCERSAIRGERIRELPIAPTLEDDEGKIWYDVPIYERDRLMYKALKHSSVLTTLKRKHGIRISFALFYDFIWGRQFRPRRVFRWSGLQKLKTESKNYGGKKE